METTDYSAVMTAYVIPIATGLICGLVPFTVGRVRGYTRAGVLGLILCTIGGFFLGLILALPIAGLFTFLIVRRGRRDDAIEAENRAAAAVDAAMSAQKDADASSGGDDAGTF